MKRNTFEEMKAIIAALEQGKVIQRCYAEEDNKWEDIVTFPNFGYSTYRIKPEEPKKWRPFKNVDEFFQVAGGLGAIWVKRKVDGVLQLVIAADPSDDINTICVQNSTWVSVKRLLDNFTFADGTPCGVEEDA